ncbi:MAG: cytochrome c3 family protein [Thermoguttaceae bacterium]|jgi:nitrate/TMAO reductase-like tetraheme cytochrome c subunit
MSKGWRQWLAATRALAGHPIWPAIRWLLIHGGILLGSLFVLMLLLAGLAGWYTSRPQFCRSCHIMEPYYKSWQESSHKDVSCIECHFPPGFGGKVRGKLLGLVQLAKYVTASAGPRPAAEIADASCLRGGCHETRLLTGRVDFHGVPFDHTPHMGQMRRGKQLRCTSCHSQIVQGQHMTVTTSTCFLCHFKGQPFNEDLGACTHCHQIPDEEFDLGGGVTFTHDLAYAKGVDCANCHGDVIRGTGEVPRERCLSCHNREGDLERAADHVFMHAKHVTEHKIDCLLCHLQIVHALDRHKIEHAAADCQSCHPDHHREQVSMLQGTGGKLVTAPANGMLAVRLECRTCHRIKQVSPTGTVTWRGTTEMCLMCHDTAAVKQFTTYHVKLQRALPELESVVLRIREALKSQKLFEARVAKIAAELADVQQDLDFVRTANDVHNMHYATQLDQALVERLSALCRELKIAEPQVTLPPPMKGR